METKTDQASGASLHSIGQHHQQHSSSSNTSTNSNKGINGKSNDLLPSIQQETNVASASSSMNHTNTTSLSQEGSTSSSRDKAGLCPATFTPMTLTSIPILSSSADLQFTHQPYHRHHHQEPQHIQHTASNLSVEKDADAGTSMTSPSFIHHCQRQEEVDEMAARKDLSTTLASTNDSCSFRDTRDPRSRSVHLDSSTSGAQKGSTLASASSTASATLSSSNHTLQEDVEGGSKPLQPLEVNIDSSSVISSKHNGTQLKSKDSPFSTSSSSLHAGATSADHLQSQNRISPTGATKTRRAKPVQLTPGYSLEPSFTVTAPVEVLTTIQESRRSSLGDELSTDDFKRKSSKHIIGTDTFQLQPVPACKRRKPSTMKNSPNKISPERRRRKENQMSSSGPSMSNRIKKASHPTGLRTSMVHRTLDSHPVPLINENRGAARHEGNAWITPLAPLQQLSKIRMNHPRLSRTQSLPNLKAKPVIDISAPALHRLVMPPRLAEYLSLLRSHAKRQEMGETSSSHCSPQQSPQSDGSYLNTGGSLSSGHPSQLKSRNGFCSTAVDALGNVKSIFIPSLYPPITRQTLKELDLHEILKNPQLRHDIVFDSNVQFRPNFDGERGKKKKEFGNKYWFAVQREIESGCTCTSFLGKSLLPCACGRGDGGSGSKEANTKFTSSLSSVPSPNLFSVANYAHSGSSFGSLHSNGKGSVATPTPTTASIGTPLTSFGVRGNRVPSRLPLLIQELRAICLSVLPTPATSLVTSTMNAKTPTTATSSKMMPSSMQSMANQMHQRQAHYAALTSPSSTRSAMAASAVLTPSTCSSAVSTHHLLIAQALDANLITQQIQHGVLDIANLMKFLGSILKQHCAPMRDELIEKMIKIVCEDGNVALGLRMCFEILELMKLDIANHQLRSSRTYLIETAVDFENRWYREQLHHRKMQLDRTSKWYLAMHRQIKAMTSSGNLTRTELISVSIDSGFMQLIFDPVHSRLPTSPSISTDTSKGNTPMPNLIAGVTPSSAIHSHPCVNTYPETFQFDTFRLMSFHGDVTDITIVYMLLLLFRQLACSTSNLSTESLTTSTRLLSNSKVIENASKIATAQSNSVKSEIWTLLHEADLEITAAGGNTQTALNLPTPKTPSTSGIAARLLNQSAFTSSQKLENVAWRKAMGNVVLQIAARAIDVQIEARSSETLSIDGEKKKSPPPSEETIRLLNSWMDTNLRVGSRLHLLCQDRIKNVIAAFTSGKQSQPVKPQQSGQQDDLLDESGEGTMKGKKRNFDMEVTPASPASKRIRLDNGSANVNASVAKKSDPRHTVKGEIELAIQKGGLEPFQAELKLLSERITKVKSFHLRVFQSLYETMALDA